MKRALLTLSVVGAICLSACEKDQIASPGGESIKIDKGIQCHQCGGGWDINGDGSGSGEGTNGFRYIATDTLSTPAPLTPVKQAPVKSKQ